MRDSMIIYRSFYESILGIPKNNQAEVWQAIFEYSLNFNEVELKGISKSIFTLIKPQLDANIKRFENGKKAKTPKQGSKTEANEEQEEIKDEANNNVNLNDNENNNHNENPNEFAEGSFLTNMMINVFNEYVPEYTYSKDLDNKPLGLIIKYITEQAKLTKDPAIDNEAKQEVLNAWRMLSDTISKDQFYRNKGLNTIANNLQTIVQTTKNGIIKPPTFQKESKLQQNLRANEAAKQSIRERNNQNR